MNLSFKRTEGSAKASNSAASIAVSRLFDAFEVSKSPQRMRAMEGLRGYAILLVFVCHYYEIVWQRLPQSPRSSALGLILMGSGGTGVDLFFVLSGYLIYAAVHKNSFALLPFLKRRAHRIYPTFLVVFVIYLLLFMLLPPNSKNVNDAGRLPLGWYALSVYLVENLLFLPGIARIYPLMNVAWSLSYEWFFYLTLPVFAWATRFAHWKRSVRVVTLFVLIVVAILTALVWPSSIFVPLSVSRNSHIRAVMFLGGMLVYEFIGKHPKPLDLSRKAEITLVLLCLVGLAVAGVHNDMSLAIPLHMRPRGEAITAGSLVTVYTLLVVAAVTPGTLLNWAFSWRPLCLLGNISYSFYLIHSLPLHVIGSPRLIAALPSGLVIRTIVFVGMMPVAFFITFLCSAALFLLVERPVSLGGSLGNRTQGTSDVLPTPS